MSRLIKLTLVWIGGLVALPTAQGQEEVTPHAHGVPVEFVMPNTYPEAVGQIQDRLHIIAELMEADQLEQVHAQADVIKKLGQAVGMLALKADSGVPKEAVKEVNLAGKDLAGKFDAIDKAADSGDAAGTRKIYDEMVESLRILSKYVPRSFLCPMRCEREKAYAAEGQCPVCHMALSEMKAHADHSPKHGGTFFMAPDQKHHLEGTFLVGRELRIYFYDEFTRPIPGEPFTAEGKVWTVQDDKSERPLRLTLEPDKKAYLTAIVDNALRFPLRAKIFIDFKDGQKPQVFDFEFTQPSKDEHAVHQGDDDHAPVKPHEGHGGGIRK